MTKNNLFSLFHKQSLTPLLLAVFTVRVLIFGCTSKNQKYSRSFDDPTEFYEIDFVKCFDTKQKMNISEIAETVEYIELKTPYDLVIARTSDVVLFEDYLLITSRGVAYLFHKSGQFIRQIGAKGQGPGEYNVAGGIAIDPAKKEILVITTNGLLFYNFDGVFLRGIKLPFYFTEFGGISDSIIWMADKIATNTRKYKAFAILSNASGDTLASIPNRYYGKKTSGIPSIALDASVRYFYQYNESLYFKGNSSNDTIWKLSGINATPHAYINMGKYKLPFEYEFWVSVDEHIRNSDRYWGVKSVQEDDNCFFLFSRNLKMREPTPETERTPSRNLSAYIVYDKIKKRGFAASDENGTGLTDDIMGGPPLWPLWVSDGYYINAVEAEALLEKVASGNYSPAAPLKELLSRIDEDTNQILILCRKKETN